VEILELNRVMNRPLDLWVQWPFARDSYPPELVAGGATLHPAYISTPS